MFLVSARNDLAVATASFSPRAAMRTSTRLQVESSITSETVGRAKRRMSPSSRSGGEKARHSRISTGAL